MHICTSKQQRDFVPLHVFYASDIYVKDYFRTFWEEIFVNFLYMINYICKIMLSYLTKCWKISGISEVMLEQQKSHIYLLIITSGDIW